MRLGLWAARRLLLSLLLLFCASDSATADTSTATSFVRWLCGTHVVNVPFSNGPKASCTAGARCAVISWGRHFGGGAKRDGGDYTAMPEELADPEATPGVRLVAASKYAFAALKADGSVAVWGQKVSGGAWSDGWSGTDSYSGVPSDVTSPSPGAGVVAIASSDLAFAAIKEDGSVTAWGNHKYGGARSATSEEYTAVPASIANPATEDDRVVSIASTGYAFAALKADGSLTAWGDVAYGGATNELPTDVTSPDPGAEVAWIASNFRAFAAVKVDGSVTVWGDTSSCGATSDTTDYTAAPSDVTSPDPGAEVVAVAASQQAFAFLKADGSVSVCGHREYGGSRSETSFNPDWYSGAPLNVEVPIAGAEVIHIAANYDAFAALKADGSVSAWGRLSRGGSMADGADYTGVPSELASIGAGSPKAISIINTFGAFVAVREDGSALAWGGFQFGGASAGESSYTAIPATVDAVPGAISVEDGTLSAWAATRTAIALLKSNGGIAAWGETATGGDHPASLDSPSYDSRITAIATSYAAVAVLRADGMVEVWGSAGDGGAGSDGSDYTHPPASVTSPATYMRTVAIAGAYTAFAALVEVSECPSNSVPTTTECAACNAGSFPEQEGGCALCPAGTYVPACSDGTTQPVAREYVDDFDLWGRTLRLSGRDGQYSAKPGVPTSPELTCCDTADFYGASATTFTELQALWDDHGDDDMAYNLSLPFAFTLGDDSWSDIYITRQGYIGFQPQTNNSPASFDQHWATPKVSGLYADFVDGRVFVSSDDDLVVVAFVNMTAADGRVGSFTIALSSRSYAQITFHEQAMAGNDTLRLSSGITGLSAGTAPSIEAGWEATEFAVCLGITSCSPCEAGTAAPKTGSAACEVCPGNGCSGHGKCDAVQGCLCDPLYYGAGCEERQNVEASMAFGFIALFIMLGLAVQCVCRGKEQEFVKSVTKRTLDPALWQVVVNMEIARRFKSIIVQKSALAVLYDLKLQWAAPLTAAPMSTLKLCASALLDVAKLASVLLGIIFFNYIVLFIQMVGNVFLLAKGFFSDNLEEFEQQIDRINDAISDFFSQFHFRWLADISINAFDVLRHINFKFLALDSMDVTCDGSQAPIVLFGNLLIILAILTLLRLNIFPFLRITLSGLLGTVSDMMGIKRMLGQPGSRLVILLWAVVLTSAEGLFKYCVQLLASLMDYGSFFPYHKSNVNCDGATSNMDTTLAILSTILAYAFVLPAVHVVLRTVVPGIPKDAVFQQMSGRANGGASSKAAAFLSRVLSRSTASSSASSSFTDHANTRIIDHFRPDDPDLDAQWVLAHKSFQEHKAVRLKHMTVQSTPNVPDISQLCSLIWQDYKSSSSLAEATSTIRLYLYCMVWKVWKLVQITFGYWDDDAIAAFNIKPLAEKFDDDITDDDLHHSSMMSVIGVAHTLAWQFFSSTVVLSKLGEAVNEQEHSPFIVAYNSDVTVADAWSGDYVRLTPNGPVKEEQGGDQGEASGKIVAVLQRRVWPAPEELEEKQTEHEGRLQDDRVPFVLRGVDTAFTDEVENGDVVVLCHPDSGEAFMRLTVDSVVNDAILYGSVPAAEAQELPDGVVGKLIDYDIDDAVVMEFNRSKAEAKMKRRRRLACCCCCCCCRKGEPTVAPAASERDDRRKFAAEIDALAESPEALEYRIERAEEGGKEADSVPRWKRWYRAVRDFFSGRYNKCIIRTIRLVIEIGLVISPSALWLEVFFLLAFPSTLTDSLHILWNCGLSFGSLDDMLATLQAGVCCQRPHAKVGRLQHQKSLRVGQGIASAIDAANDQIAGAAQAVADQTGVAGVSVHPRMGFMSRLGHSVLQLLRSRFSVQGVVLGDTPEECEMVEDAISQWREMSECKAVNAEETSAAVESAGNVMDALASVARRSNPLTDERSNEATDAQIDEGERAMFNGVDEVEGATE